MNYMKYSRGELQDAAVEICKRLGLIDRFSIDVAKLRNFIADVSRHMKRVPYHNFTHAFNIMHMTYIVLTQTKMRSLIEDIDVLSVIIGALGHDIDHPGVNNVFF